MRNYVYSNIKGNVDQKHDVKSKNASKMSRTDVFESGGDLQYGAISTPIATRTRPDAIAEPTLSVTAALDRFADASFTTRDKGIF